VQYARNPVIGEVAASGDYLARDGVFVLSLDLAKIG
jgi:hypothetical protein